jgi:flagellar hook-associated protein 2
MISFSGVGSGLDLEGLITQLLAAERQPVQTRLDSREANLQSQLSAVGTMKGALANFRDSALPLADSSRLLRSKAESSNPDVIEASAANVDQESTFTIEVNALAAAQRLASGAFDDPSDEIGSGTLTIERGRYDSDSGSFTTATGGSPITLALDASNNTLTGLRDALQSEGIHASIVYDGAAYRLALGPTATGMENSLRITAADDDGDNLDASGLSQLAFDPAATEGAGRNLTETVAASDAELVVDGLPITRGENQIDDLIEGLTLDLKKAAQGEALSVTAGVDRDAASTSIAAFVESYNEFVRVAKELSAVNSESGERGPLVGDASVRGLLSQLRREFSETVVGVSGAFRSATDLGITTALDGTLELDGARLAEALEEDHLGVASVFSQLADSSDALISVSEADPALPAGRYAVVLTQVPSAGSYTGAGVNGTTVDSNNDGLRVAIDGIESGAISINSGSYASGAELAVAIQAAINQDDTLRSAGVSARVDFDADTGSLTLASATVGSVSSLEILETDLTSAITLGISVAAGVPGADVAGSIGGIPATGTGGTLNGTGSLQGLSLSVQGGVIGERGEVSVSGGLAARLQSVADSLLSSQGALSARSDGINARIEDLGEERERLDLRLGSMESRLRAQFGALDQLVAGLTSTGNFLSQQLANLPGFSRQTR